MSALRKPPHGAGVVPFRGLKGQVFAGGRRALFWFIMSRVLTVYLRSYNSHARQPHIAFPVASAGFTRPRRGTSLWT